MSVEPEASGPTWPVPPKGGWTADDLDRLPNLPPHTELIDGSLVFVSPQTILLETDEGRPVVHVFELEPATRTYVPTGIFHDDLKVSVPFTIELDLTAIPARRSAPESP
ncbi:hypothetical protein AB0933_03030 [Streptomyces venezuelae]|uniref:hypothetical protein n=1 Tax=Streptomyces venezuelae TaxID=54571 RepID=UPI003455242F